MQNVLILAVASLMLSSVAADIKQPRPPRPPDLPTVDGMSKIDRAAEPDQLTLSIIRLDSIRTAADILKEAQQRLKEDEEAILKALPSASLRRETYGLQEVDQKPIAIRRILPPIPGSSSIEATFVITPEGKTSDIRLISAPISHTDQITESISIWLFTPALKADQRVPVRITTSLRLSEK